MFISACSGDAGKEEQKAIVVKKSVGYGRIRHGRIYEKEKVIDIPLSALENNLNGKVHTVRFTGYKYTGKTKTLADSGTNVYNASGMLTAQHRYNEKGKVLWKAVYTYNAAGMPEHWFIHLSGAVTTDDTTTFSYDKAGRRIKAVVTSSLSSRGGRKEYFYDRHGQETEMRAYNSAGVLKTNMRSIYDNKGDQVLLAEVFPDGTPYISRQAAYDAAGNIVSLSFLLGDSVTRRTEMVNDTRGKHTDIKMYSGSGALRSHTVCTYDEHGNMTSRTTRDSTGKQQGYALRFVHEYDAAGNVTSETVLRSRGTDWQPQTVTLYRYTYHP